jgi:hypothetical protein
MNSLQNNSESRRIKLRFYVEIIEVGLDYYVQMYNKKVNFERLVIPWVFISIMFLHKNFK